MGEKVEFSKWWLLVVVLMLLTAGIFTAAQMGLLPFWKKVEREVLVNSHQYKEGMNQRAATLSANIAEIEAQLLNPTLDEGTKANLNAQLAALRVQFRATMK